MDEEDDDNFIRPLVPKFTSTPRRTSSAPGYQYSSRARATVLHVQQDPEQADTECDDEDEGTTRDTLEEQCEAGVGDGHLMLDHKEALVEGDQVIAASALVEGDQVIAATERVVGRFEVEVEQNLTEEIKSQWDQQQQQYGGGGDQEGGAVDVVQHQNTEWWGDQSTVVSTERDPQGGLGYSSIAELVDDETAAMDVDLEGALNLKNKCLLCNESVSDKTAAHNTPEALSSEIKIVYRFGLVFYFL